MFESPPLKPSPAIKVKEPPSNDFSDDDPAPTTISPPEWSELEPAPNVTDPARPTLSPDFIANEPESVVAEVPVDSCTSPLMPADGDDPKKISPPLEVTALEGPLEIKTLPPLLAVPDPENRSESPPEDPDPPRIRTSPDLVSASPTEIAILPEESVVERAVVSRISPDETPAPLSTTTLPPC